MSFSKEIGASMEHLRCNRAPGSHPSKPDAGSVYSRPTNPNQEGSPAGQVHGIAGAVFPFPGQGIMSAQTGGVFSESLSQYSEGHYPHHGVSDHFTPLVQAVAEGAPNYAPWYYDDRMTPYAPQGMPRSEYPDNVLSEHEDFPSMLELSRGHPSPPRENIPSFQSTSSESELASKHNEAGINLYLAAPASSSSQKQARGTPQQLVWDPRSDTQAPVGPLKRPRTQEARSQTRHIRSRGGACAFCRKNRRRCSPDHPPAGPTKKPRLQASSSTSGHNAAPSSSNSSNDPNSPSGSSFSPVQGWVSPNEGHSTHVPHEAATVGLGEQFTGSMQWPALPQFSYTESNFNGYAEQDVLGWQNSLIEGRF